MSHIKVNIEMRSFEKDFFAIDTTDIANSVHSLLQQYPRFMPVYIENILGLKIDSLSVPKSSQGIALRWFIRDYLPIKDSADKILQDFGDEKNDITRGLQFVKYYFPAYHLPKYITTFIGPADASFQTSFGTQGDIITTEDLGIGLQLHLGKDFFLYQSAEGQELYPDYISQNFDPAHIPVNCMKNIVDDLYPENTTAKALIEQMVEQGKRLYLLTKFLPDADEHLLLNYNEKQLSDSYHNEAVIWDFFLNNELLNSSEQNIIKNYIGESPKTPEFGNDSPGNLGSFTGLQIVKKYMEKYPDTALQQLLKIDPRKIYTESKYKPRA
ncbi:MAG: hypothetical protein ABIR19_00245 [Ginsengibacter sp.]